MKQNEGSYSQVQIQTQIYIQINDHHGNYWNQKHIWTSVKTS